MGMVKVDSEGIINLQKQMCRVKYKEAPYNMKSASHFLTDVSFGQTVQAETKQIRTHLAGGMPHGLMHTSSTDVAACWECARLSASLSFYGCNCGNRGFLLTLFGVFLPHLSCIWLCVDFPSGQLAGLNN
ncbi:uncharacterized [Tachysurus ichikawai]